MLCILDLFSKKEFIKVIYIGKKYYLHNKWINVFAVVRRSDILW